MSSHLAVKLPGHIPPVYAGNGECCTLTVGCNKRIHNTEAPEISGNRLLRTSSCNRRTIPDGKSSTGVGDDHYLTHYFDQYYFEH